jgi:hypothetical protein
MQLRYFVPFKAQEGVSAEYALKEKLINIEGVAIDTSVNANKWQIPAEDLDFFVETLMNAQLRVDHAESALMVIGKVAEAKHVGNQVLFRAEVGEEKLIEKILRNYVNHVSAQVDSDDVECSKCKKPTRKEGMLVHLCPGAWEIVHKPKVRELSIVASPAYQTTEFQPVGFYAAMNDSQYDAILKNIQNSQLSEDNKDVGSKPEGLQEPENKKSEAKKEVKPLSEQNAQAKASPHQAQGVVNVAPGESAPKQVTYQELMDQVTKLQKQIGDGGVSATDSEIDALGKKIADIEGELAKRAKKAELSKKISDLTKQLQTPTEQGESGDGEAGFPPKAEGAEAGAQKNAGKASGKGIVAVDEIQKDVLGNYDWFKDILKAHRMLQTQTFKG